MNCEILIQFENATCDTVESKADSNYINSDLAPTSLTQRTWGLKEFVGLWVALAACIPTYMLASSLIEEGMNWWQAIATISLGNVIVLVPMILNAHPGARYGIPFPVYCRASFGLRGANIPALLRAVVACGWFGIQTWLGGWAIYQIGIVYVPGLADAPPLPALGITGPQLLCFLFFWSINVLVVWRGINSIRLLLKIKAPLLIVLGLLLLGWAWWTSGGVGPMLAQPSQFDENGPKSGQFWSFFFPALTANVGFWATLALNIPDFSRYARSQNDQIIGQAVGLPMAMTLFSFIGVAVTSATVVIYGEAIWDPVVVVSHFGSPLVHALALTALCLATLATNVAANVVSPANDFANLWPRRISFRTGGLITALIGLLIQPWRLVQDPSGYIFRWLVAYSALLGSICGVLVADYFVLRRTRLDLSGLYHKAGPYWYHAGFNLGALVAIAAGIAPCVPGFLATVALIDVAETWLTLYHYAWFLSFAISFGVYVLLMGIMARKATSPPE